MGSFLKELAEEGNVKFGFAKKLGINQIKLLEIEGGRNTVSMDIENGTFTPEKLLAMEEAIKSYLRQKDIENRIPIQTENLQGKSRQVGGRERS